MTTITLTKEQMYDLCNGLSITIDPPKQKVNKWQPSIKKYYVNVKGGISVSDVSDLETADFGLCYDSLEKAEKARDAMRTRNRLLAWLAENDDGWVADWNNPNKGKYYIFSSSNLRKKYSFSSDYDYKDITRVYMSVENANKLCKLLNEGVVEL